MLTTNFNLTGIMGDVMQLFNNGHPAITAYIDAHLPKTFCRATSKTKRGAVQPPRVMLNCLIFRYVNTTRRAIKIFSNGGIHVTGALDADAAVADATLVCKLFDVVLGVPPGTCAVTGYQLQVGDIYGGHAATQSQATAPCASRVPHYPLEDISRWAWVACERCYVRCADEFLTHPSRRR